jgi:amino acid transporter
VLSPARSSRAAGRLSASALVLLALSATAPLAVVAGVVPAAYARGEVPFVPLTFLAAGLVLLLFGAGYAAMVRRGPAAGALYAFVARGLGRPVGVGAAGLAVLSYLAVQVGLAGAVGLAVASLWPAIPWWAVAAAGWLLVTIGGLLPVRLAVAVPAVLVPAQIALITGFAAANVLSPAPGRPALDMLLPAPVDRPALGLLLVAAALTFIGFETTAAYAGETARPRRSIARATTLAVVLLALLYAGSAWAISMATGPDLVTAWSAGRGPELVFDLAAERLAPWAVPLGRVLLPAGLLAAMIALHHTVSRYVRALARERLLPTGLDRPVPAALAQSAVAGALLAGLVGSGWAPAEFGRLVTAGALGILLVLVATSAATLLFLNRTPGFGFSAPSGRKGAGGGTAPGRETVWRRLVAPAAATVLLGALVYLAFARLPAVLDVAAGHPLTYALPGGYAGVLLSGVAYAFVVKAARPIAYAGIGLGGTAVVVTPALPRPREPGAHRPERVAVSRRTPGSERA